MNFDNFRTLISELTSIPINNIHPSTSFKDDLAIDSLQMVNLVIELSTRLQTDFHAVRSIEDFSTVQGMYETFTKKDVTA